MSQPDPVAAIAVLRAFTEANGRGDVEAMKGCLSRETLEGGGFSGPMPGDMQFSFGPEEVDGERVIIPMAARPAGAPEEGGAMMSLRCIMVQEDGAWKFDLKATMQQMEELMDAAMKEVGQKMGEVMGGAMDAIGEAMAGAMGSASAAEEPMLDSSEEVSSPFGLEDLFPVMEVVRLDGASAAVSAAVGKDLPVFADMAGLLGLFGADDPSKMLPWLDNDFCAGLGPAIAAAGEKAQQLRIVRIEAAIEPREFFIALDGAELVYRVDVRYDDTWYRMQEDLLKIIPGVVMGMGPAAADVPEGMTSMPREGWWPTVTRYREAWVPRHMRDIREAAGSPVRLEADWESFYAESFDGRGLVVWGLCRVAGAVALHVRDTQPPAGWLKTIKLVNGYDTRRANFVDGVLTMAIVGVEGEKGCFYEHDLARVFGGEVIGPLEAP